MRVASLGMWMVLAGCTATGAGGGEGGELSPKRGLWQGPEISFRLSATGKMLTELTLTPHSCSGEGGCTATVGGPLAGSWGYGATFHARPAGGSVDGNFAGETAVAGTLDLAAGTCCKVTTAWQAYWVGDGDASSGDATAANDEGGGPDGSGGNDGAPESSDAAGGADDGGPVELLPWDGASFGTIHPGPAAAADSPPAPAGLSADQASAIALLNGYRNAVGAPVVAGDTSLSKAAKAHADFYVAHVAKYNSTGLSPHKEDQSFGTGFTGVDFWNRCSAAGFQGQPSGEVIAFEGTPAAALQGWIDTVYHRLPLLSPATELIGFGSKKSGSTAADVIDSSARQAAKSDPIIVWPWPGQHNVPASWNGLEGPTPPKPSSGWPSGPVITAQFWKTTAVAAHELRNAQDAAVAHTWLDYKTDPNLQNLAPATVALYANKPLSAGTYSVKLTLVSGDVLAWRFVVGK